MAGLTDAVKRAPRWAWFTVAGVGVGAGAIKLWRDRDAPPTEPTTDPGSEIGAVYPEGPGAPGAGVIVPPVIYNPPSADTGGLADLTELYISAVGGLMDEWGEVYGPIANLLPQMVMTPGNVADYISALAPAGGQPAPAPVVVTVAPPPAAAPAPPPAPAAPAPRCPSDYPHGSPPNCHKNCGHCDRDSRGRKYRNHGHCYQNGKRVHVGNDYPGGC